jgi:opacity protein-like surface antigen
MKSYLTALAVLLLSGAAAQAQTDNSRFFTSVLAGGTSHPRLDFGASHPEVDNGFNAGARAGVNLNGLLGNGFSLDADYFYNQGDFKGAADGARLNSHSLMADLTYHAPVADRWGLYGGAGVGAVHTNLSGSSHGGATVLGWQALGGVDYAVNERTSLFAEYRYQNAHNVNIPGTGAVGNTSNNLSMGVKISF